MTTNVQAGLVQQTSRDRCRCGHLKVDHSDRPDQRASVTVPKRPWCHTCSAVCNYVRRGA